MGKSVYEVASKEVANVWNKKDQELIDRPHVQVYEFTTLGSTVLNEPSSIIKRPFLMETAD